MLVHLAMHGSVDPSRIERLGIATFSDPRCRAVLEALRAEGWQPRDFSTILTAVDSTPGARDLTAQLTMRPVDYDDPGRTADDCMMKMLQKRMRRGMEALDRDIRAAEAAGDTKALSALQAKKVRLKKETIKGALA